MASVLADVLPLPLSLAMAMAMATLACNPAGESSVPDPERAAAPSQAPAPGAHKLAFWRVTAADPDEGKDGGSTRAGDASDEPSVYVLGWIPLGETTRLRFDAVIADAFERSSHLILPTDAALKKQNALIGWKAHLAEGDALADWVPEDLHEAYTRAIGAGGYPPGTAEVTAPWFAARIVETADWRRTGFVGESAFQSEVEKYFVHRARHAPANARKEIVPLEEAGAVYDRYVGLPRDTQVELLRTAVARSARAAETLPAAQTAWQHGDLARLAELENEIQEAGGKPPRGLARARAAENAKLAAEVARRLHETSGTASEAGAAFLVVPMQNLVSPDGLLATLREAHLRVEQLVSRTGGGTVTTPLPAVPHMLPPQTPVDASRPRVLLVGIDGATLRIIEPLIEAGRLPALAELARAGASGPLRSHQPIYSPRIWNSIATGKTPAKHGVEGFTYKDEAGEQQLYLSLHRKAHALWNIASDAGLTVGVVNWWNTYPPDVLRGVMVSDHAKPTRLAELRNLTGAVTGEDHGATVYPASFGARVSEVFAARETIASTQDPFLGTLGLPPFMQREELSKRYYDDTATAQIALDVDRREAPELLMVFLAGIDRVSHRLWAAVEPAALYPETLQLSEGARTAAKAALEQYYAFSDELIGLLMQRFGPQDLVLVLSDHGFEAGEHLGDLTGVHDGEDALDGVLFARGPGIAAGASTRGTSVNDITPTILAWLGLPLARDMDGRVAAFLTPPVPAAPVIATHDVGEIRRLELSPSGSETEILDQLRALGYIE